MKSKIQQVTGLRIGELLITALDPDAQTPLSEMYGKLFYIEDEDLTRIVKDYLAEHKTKESVEEK